MKKSMIWHHMHCVSSLPALRNRQGAALIPIIIAIVIISAIGAALLSLSSVGTFNSLLGNSADRAYYLAESGFRYAAMTYRHGGAGEIDAINNQTFTVAANQQFALELRNYKMQVDGGDGTGTLEAMVPFGFAPLPEVLTDNDETNDSGYLVVGGGNEQAFSDANLPDSEGQQINFQKAAGNWNLSVGEPVRFAARSNGSPVSQGGNLQLQDGTADDFFPPHNGRFTANDRIYQYDTRDRTNNVLRGITHVDGTWVAPGLNPNEAIVLNDFVAVHSTGAYGQGYFGASRHLTYHVPFSEAAPGGQFHDTFDNKDNWIEENNKDSAEGAHEIQGYNGDRALAVTETDRIGGTELDSSLIEFDRAAAGLDLEGQWTASGNYLSYDAQVKMQTNGEPVFMDGISFRLDENLNSYGISLLKAASDGADGIPYSIVPQEGQAMVVLWERNDPDYNNWTWLAYQTFETDELFVSDVFFEDNMEGTPPQWTPGGNWELITSEYHSPNHCWRAEGYEKKSNWILESRSINLSGASQPYLSFWHIYYKEGNARGKIEISIDGGANWQELAEYQDTISYRWWWREAEIDLSAYAGESDVKIRFNLSTGNQKYKYWYLDDVKIYDSDWPSLMVSVKEAYSVSFSGGNTPINAGDTVYQEDAGGATPSATVYTDPVLESGNWTSENPASGDLLLRNVSGTFQTGEDLFVGGVQCATADAVNGKQNYIRAYIGDTEAHGTPSTDPLDRQRLANPRDNVNWPPREADDTVSTNDYFTLVQWNDNLDGSVTRLGTGNEQDAVIRTDSMTTPDNTFPATRPELGLHTWGWGSVDGMPNSSEVPDIYFDDFAVRLDGGTASGGFAPAIQESAAGE